MPRHFLEVDDLTRAELLNVLDEAENPAPGPLLQGLGVALIFEKPSTRTRNATEMAVAQLGGHPVSIRPDEIGLDSREPVEDVVRTLGLYHCAIGARVFHHHVLERMASGSRVPVVNLLSDVAHPMQTLADLLTIRQHFGRLDGLTVAYVGDGNNVCRSLMVGAALCGMKGRVAAPPGYDLGDVETDHLRGLGLDLMVTHVPEEAVEGADVVYTDVWASMGHEDEADQRRREFEHFTVDEPLMARAGPDSVLLHCLPAHRGEEVSAEVIDGPRSLVWPQAENRMHAARSLLGFLVGSG